jgi:hypothetical protein
MIGDNASGAEHAIAASARIPPADTGSEALAVPGEFA